MSDPETVEWFKERIHNQKHFTARHIAHISQISGMEPELIAKIGAGVIFVILALSEQGFILCNFLLTIVPFLLIFVYPDEKPTDESLYTYYSLFGLLTVFDRAFEKITFYYVAKLALFLLLFVPPYKLIDKVDEVIKNLINEANKKSDEKSTRSRKSSKTSLKTAEPAKTENASKEGEGSKKKSLSSHSSTVKVTITEEYYREEELLSPNGTVISRIVKGPYKKERVESENAPDSTRSNPTPATGDEGSRRLKIGQNPMESSSAFNLRSELDGFNSSHIGPANNLNDMWFFPTEKLVFNAPFDFDNLTYHMKIINNSYHRIAYAVKGNAVPRVMANPPFGVLEVKESRLIAVTVQKFNWNDTDFEKDRLAFDYVILPDTNKEKNFSFKMLQQSTTKRRKNIRIMYNP
ncbi:unnamed protein product [Caenorhabditis bovis]|uniref:Major sperm protein n=2 Tax=Caenorhabditis bovis TaxID=2654633 RepID=A0A8S1EXL6_9PELO|nr:unnamed protein product [Caenorhabditis bovis]